MRPASPLRPRVRSCLHPAFLLSRRMVLNCPKGFRANSMAMAASSTRMGTFVQADKGYQLLVGLREAVLKQDLQSMLAFSPDLAGWIGSCCTVSQNNALTALISYCDKLKGRSFLKLWKAFNLVLTAVAADFFGLQSDELLTLRKLNFQMSFEQIVTSSPAEFHLFPEEASFIRSGLAVQAWLDFRAGAPLGNVDLADIIVVAEGLVQGPCHYKEEWLLFVMKASEGGDPDKHARGSEGASLESFKANDCSDKVWTSLELILRRVESEMVEEARTAWVRILWSMPFVGLVKSLRHLLNRAVSHRQLAFLLNTGLISNWLDTAPDDAAAMAELRDLLRDLQKSRKIYVEQKQVDTASDQLGVVLHAIRLYILVVMTIARGGLKHGELILDPCESMAARGWLLLLQEKVSSADVEPFTVEEYEYAGKALKLALQLNEAPSEYRICENILLREG